MATKTQDPDYSAEKQTNISEMNNSLKDAIPVSFRSELFTYYILPHLGSETYSSNYEKTAKYSYKSMHVKLLQNYEFVENVWPTKSVLFIYVSTHCDKTVK